MTKNQKPILICAILGLFSPILTQDVPIWRDFVIGAAAGAVVGYIAGFIPTGRS